MTRQSAISASRGRSRQGIGRRSTTSTSRRDEPGERAARRRHEPGIEREHGKPRHRQRGGEEGDRDRAEDKAEKNVIAAHGEGSIGSRTL